MWTARATHPCLLNWLLVCWELHGVCICAPDIINASSLVIIPMQWHETDKVGAVSSSSQSRLLLITIGVCHARRRLGDGQ